ncbi:Hypothetical predicted protein [Xyrichtys novacula]|uniref:Uncharacterized protein n=1 Tax=Xyrichtys novacula TaxID=13765 RepID=A0AAV1HR66_XYRNO|nr:Hypothetical predicted protein [Xyrichtys novacula]
MRPAGNGSRDLGCLGAPCPPPLVKQKRSTEGPPLTLVRAVTHSADASVLTSGWLKYPPRPVALHPPVTLHHHYLLILYADLFPAPSLLLFQLLSKLQTKVPHPPKRLQIQFKSPDPDSGASCVTPTPKIRPFLHTDDKDEKDEEESPQQRDFQSRSETCSGAQRGPNEAFDIHTIIRTHS